MKFLCLCPTYNHARLLSNTLACFAAQDHADRYMLILDDAGQITPQSGDRWRLVSTADRCTSLPAKYNAMLAIAANWCPDWDAVAVWDDDDVYLPWHLSAAAAAMQSCPPGSGGAVSAKPSAVWSSHTHRLVCRNCGITTRDLVCWEAVPCRLCGSPDTVCWPMQESGVGRFHGSLVLSRAVVERIGGWVQTRRADFDQQQLAAAAAAGPVIDMLAHSPHQVPSYVYRWQTTASAHCSGLMASPDNETWYDRHAVRCQLPPVGLITPAFDAESAYLLRVLPASPVNS